MLYDGMEEEIPATCRDTGWRMICRVSSDLRRGLHMVLIGGAVRGLVGEAAMQPQPCRGEVSHSTFIALHPTVMMFHGEVPLCTTLAPCPCRVYSTLRLIEVTFSSTDVRQKVFEEEDKVPERFRSLGLGLSFAIRAYRFR
jgi:hypothetical protein